MVRTLRLAAACALVLSTGCAVTPGANPAASKKAAHTASSEQAARPSEATAPIPDLELRTELYSAGTSKPAPVTITLNDAGCCSPAKMAGFSTDYVSGTVGQDVIFTNASKVTRRFYVGTAGGPMFIELKPGQSYAVGYPVSGYYGFDTSYQRVTFQAMGGIWIAPSASPAPRPTATPVPAPTPKPLPVASAPAPRAAKVVDVDVTGQRFYPDIVALTAGDAINFVNSQASRPGSFEELNRVTISAPGGTFDLGPKNPYGNFNSKKVDFQNTGTWTVAAWAPRSVSSGPAAMLKVVVSPRPAPAASPTPSPGPATPAPTAKPSPVANGQFACTLSNKNEVFQYHLASRNDAITVVNNTGGPQFITVRSPGGYGPTAFYLSNLIEPTERFTYQPNQVGDAIVELDVQYDRALPAEAGPATYGKGVYTCTVSSKVSRFVIDLKAGEGIQVINKSPGLHKVIQVNPAGSPALGLSNDIYKNESYTFYPSRAGKYTVETR